MLCPIVCYTCGMPLGDVDDLYRFARAKRVGAAAAEGGVPGYKIYTDPALSVETGDILDALKISQACCRMHMITSMEFADVA